MVRDPKTGKFVKGVSGNPSGVAKNAKKKDSNDIPQSVRDEIAKQTPEEGLKTLMAYLIASVDKKDSAMRILKEFLPYVMPKKQSSENVTQHYSELVIKLEDPHANQVTLENEFSKTLLENSEEEENEDV